MFTLNNVIAVYSLIRFSGPEVMIHAYWHFGLRRSHTRSKKYTPILFLWFYYVFLNKGPRAQRAENFRSEKYTLKEKYSLIEIRA